jgi:sortase A
MMQNPLFPTNDNQNNQTTQIPDYLRTGGTPPGSSPTQAYTQAPATPTETPTPGVSDKNAAADVIRQKLASIYADEPVADAEAAKVAASAAPVSVHAQYMQALNNSGKSWAEIQNAWHDYYVALPDAEKHAVWQEFYAANQTNTPYQRQQYAKDTAQAAPAQTIYQPAQPVSAVVQSANTPEGQVISGEFAAPADTPTTPGPETNSTTSAGGRPSVDDIKKKLLDTVRTRGGSLRKNPHMQSLTFGLASGAVVVFIFMFGFFNEFFITPFIQPSRQASETPVIVDPASAVVGDTPKVIIPKINVEIPTDYSQTTTSNKAIEDALDNGIVHYPTTVRPGQAGNAAFFGHSSNNIFNPGKYKFAFVMLHKLVEGDTFYLTYEGKAYAYEVISRRVVEPTEVGVLGPVANETATATLITCDPPGTSLKRLVVVGRQISPEPAASPAPGAAPAPVLASTEQSENLPGNGPTLWGRIWGSIF